MLKQAGVLDYPRETLDEKIWDLSEERFTLREEVKEQILDSLYLTLSNNGLVYFEDWITNIFFIGSSATYQWEEESDIDMLVIWNSALNAHQRNMFLSRLFPGRDFSLDIFAFTNEESDKLKNVPGTILYEAFHNGIVIYG